MGKGYLPTARSAPTMDDVRKNLDGDGITVDIALRPGRLFGAIRSQG